MQCVVTHPPYGKPDPVTVRQHLINYNADKIAQGYVKAKSDGLRSPVVFVVDCVDPVGRAIAERFHGVDETRRHIRSVAGDIATVILAVEHEYAVRLLGTSTTSGTTSVFNKPADPGWFWTVCIAVGGKLFAQLQTHKLDEVE